MFVNENPLVLLSAVIKPHRAPLPPCETRARRRIGPYKALVFRLKDLEADRSEDAGR